MIIFCYWHNWVGNQTTKFKKWREPDSYQRTPWYRLDFYYTLCNKSKFLMPLSCCYISADNLLCLKSIRLHLSKVDGENSLPLTNKFQLD